MKWLFFSVLWGLLGMASVTLEWSGCHQGALLDPA